MPIVLLTDFGGSDGYAGTLKGVIAKIAPHAQVIDLCHDLPAFDLEHASYVLATSYRYFPSGSIFVVVVDPGVGGERKPILVETEKFFFIAPDNGVLSLATDEQKVRRVLHLNREEHFLKPVSATFHGRDLFSPVAAHLTHGVPLENLGSPLENLHQLAHLQPHRKGKGVEGQVWTFDRFGNAITNVRGDWLAKQIPEAAIKISLERLDLTLSGPRHHYAEAKLGEAIALIGSGGFLEIALFQGSAREKLGIRKGDRVILTPSFPKRG